MKCLLEKLNNECDVDAGILWILRLKYRKKKCSAIFRIAKNFTYNFRLLHNTSFIIHFTGNHPTIISIPTVS